MHTGIKHFQQPAPRTSGAIWFFRSLIVAVVLVVLLPVGLLGWLRWRADAQRSLLERIGGGPWIVIKDNNSPAPGEEPWFAAVLGEAWQLPRTEEISLVKPFDPEAKADLDAISRVVKLNSLYLAGGPVANDDLRKISRIQSLKTLDLTATDITDGGLAALAQCPHLEELDLSATGVSDQGMQAIIQMTALRKLRLRHTQVSDVQVQILQNILPELEIVYKPAVSAEQTNAVREVIKRGASVVAYAGESATSLEIDGDPESGHWTGFEWSQLRAIPNVNTVRLVKLERPDDILAALADLGELHALWIEECIVTPATTEQMLKCRKLSDLVLHHCGIQPGLMEELGKLVQLETLSIRKTHIGTREVAAIAALPKLSQLALHDCEFESGLFAGFAFSDCLQSVEFNSGNLTDLDVQDIVKFKSLRFVSLIGNRKITDESIDVLLSLPELTSASVGATSVTAAAEERLESALKARQENRAAGVAK
jgi:Leucine-rich repeat (LRR) protein